MSASNISTAEFFGLRLRTLRDEAGMSQLELADKLNVSRASIGYYENATRTPDIDFFRKAADYFAVSYDYMIGKTDNKRRENISIGGRLGLSDAMISAIEKLHNRKTDFEKHFPETEYDVSYFTNDAYVDWAILEQLITGDGFSNICTYIKSTVFGPQTFLVLSVRNGSVQQWVDARTDEILGSALSSERVAPSSRDLVVEQNDMKNVLLGNVAEELDKIRESLFSETQAPK